MGKRILVDVERGRTVRGWKPRRLGGGLGGRPKPVEPAPAYAGGGGGGGGRGGFRGGFERGRGGFRGGGRGFGGGRGGGGGFGDRGGFGRGGGLGYQGGGFNDGPPPGRYGGPSGPGGGPGGPGAWQLHFTRCYCKWWYDSLFSFSLSLLALSRFVSIGSWAVRGLLISKASINSHCLLLIFPSFFGYLPGVAVRKKCRVEGNMINPSGSIP
ncbi:hypothetical protein EI94DRAFT_483214 [Lactarius quietus]|nr:hypothetical protein EI94DRAFT_483214 [Lactarius quietus]